MVVLWTLEGLKVVGFRKMEAKREFKFLKFIRINELLIKFHTFSKLSEISLVSFNTS